MCYFSVFAVVIPFLLLASVIPMLEPRAPQETSRPEVIEPMGLVFRPLASLFTTPLITPLITPFIAPGKIVYLHQI